MITVLIFRLNIIMTIIPFECWSISEIWLYKPQIFSPYWVYVAIFFLYGVYALIEFYIGIFVSKSIFIRLVSPLLFIVATGFLIAMYCFWVFFKIQNGEATYKDYPIQLGNMHLPEKLEIPESVYPSRRDIVIAERCEKGLAISTMTLKDWERIWEIEAAIYREILNK